MIISKNPTTGVKIQSYKEHTMDQVEEILLDVQSAQAGWNMTDFKIRSELFKKLSDHLLVNEKRYAELITAEMGKPIMESKAEIQKCSWVSKYYAENAEEFLRDEKISSDASDSFVSFSPLGVILAIMPWNFPFWQVFRFAAPALMGGNTAILKHASNVSGCALAIEEIFTEVGFPKDIFRTLIISSHRMNEIIENEIIKAVTLTGSEPAGSAVASTAGKEIKKTVLELGGSDPFIVLNDADLSQCIPVAIAARFLNAGQSCIAAKRFIVEEGILNKFTEEISAKIRSLVIGDPMDEKTDIGPLAKPDLVEELHYQVKESELQGAKLLLGGKKSENQGHYYEPTLLTGVTPEMSVFREETFGPVFSIIPAKDIDDAIKLANDSQFGLGASIWTFDQEITKKTTQKIEAGAVFFNGMVKSDPRLPFGGVKKSGYGRELSHYGIKEFQNIKTIWIK
ncbi:MAG: NAD-dependent succinate-semialdehyde dehydrogenase [Fidelibacterota bacterium]